MGLQGSNISYLLIMQEPNEVMMHAQRSRDHEILIKTRNSDMILYTVYIL